MHVSRGLVVHFDFGLSEANFSLVSANNICRKNPVFTYNSNSVRVKYDSGWQTPWPLITSYERQMRFWFHVESPDFASDSDSVVAVQDKYVFARLELDVRVRMSVPDGGDQLEGRSAPDEEVSPGGEADD